MTPERNRSLFPRFQSPHPAVLPRRPVPSRRSTFIENRVIQTSYTSRGRTAVNVVEAPNQFGPQEAEMDPRASPVHPSRARDARETAKRSRTFLQLSLDCLSTRRLFPRDHCR